MDRQEQTGPGWAGRRGNAWADLQPMLDRLFSPLEGILLDAVPPEGTRDLLDIGCGTGATTLAFARRLGAEGHCTGVDVSAPLLAVARQRAAAAGLGHVRFIEADAQRHRFARTAFDQAISRFGVMFFDAPEAAFANLKSALRPDGALTCIVWRSRDDNPFMTAAEEAAAPLLGWRDRPDPEAPGQFAFGDFGRVERILRAAGWRSVEIDPLDVPCSLPVADLATYARRMGRVGLTLPDLDIALRTKVETALDAAFAPFVSDGVAHFEAACWMVRARPG